MIGFLLSTALAASFPAWASETHDFSVPAEPAPEAIRDFGSQAHVQILAAGENVKDKQLHAVNGTYSTDQGLHILLADSGLAPQYVGERSIALVSASQASAAGQQSDQSKEGKKSSSSEFRLAQATPGQTTKSAAVASDDQQQLQEVVVTSTYQFLNADTSGTTNLPLPIEKVPQSISLVSNDFIVAANLKTLGEIAEYTPGAVNGGAPENFNSQIYMRGFLALQTFDGLPVLQSYYEPDYAVFDRLEFVKGPSSVVYGVSTPGGLVNFVTKSATPQTLDYLSLQVGSWDSYRIEGQIAGALSGDGRIRGIAVGVYDQGDSFTNEVNHKKTSLYAGVNVDLSSSITGYLHGGYERQDATVFDGIPTYADGTPAPVARSFFLGSKNITTTTDVYHAEGALTWHATEMLDATLKGAYQNVHQTGGETYPCCLQENGDITLGGQLFGGSGNHYDSYGVGASALYRFDQLGLKNSFLSVSALYQSSTSHIYNMYPAGSGTANIFSSEASIGAAFDALLATANIPNFHTTDTSTLTYSGQAVIQLVDPLSLLVGASYSKPDTTLIIDGVAQNFDTSGQVSYRAGLTYEFISGGNVYVSFNQSFTPQANLNAALAVVPPATGEQYEAGVKYRTADGKGLLTAAAFQIKEKNLAQYVETTPSGDNIYQTIGELTHKGFELQALGEITPRWQINAGYTYLNPTVTGGAAGFGATEGQTETFLPKQTASVFTTYSLKIGAWAGLSVGGGVRYVGSMLTSYDNSTKDIPGYTVVDATMSYSADKWLVQLNARNLFNKSYFINNYQTLLYGNQYGAPFNVALTVRRTF